MTLLPNEDTLCLDLGFTGHPQILPPCPEEPAIYITHSLGTLWALQHCSAQMKGLISINGFPCFTRFTAIEMLKAMKAGLRKNIDLQMKQFYKRADMDNAGASSEFNIKMLDEGLTWLMTEDARPALQSLRCPIIALTGAQDKIMPLSAAQEAWQGMHLEICEDGGHNLPHTHTHWCAAHINKLLHKV